MSAKVTIIASGTHSSPTLLEQVMLYFELELHYNKHNKGLPQCYDVAPGNPEKTQILTPYMLGPGP